MHIFQGSEVVEASAALHGSGPGFDRKYLLVLLPEVSADEAALIVPTHFP
jgi:hypothetical protein